MPNRWIKEAYCTSSRIAGVSAEARDLWVRLLVNADDHGYFHGSGQIVASRCFPLQPNARRCEQLLIDLTVAGLIVRYESGGKQYLAITQWYERPRSKPKYPPPPESISAQLHGHENNCEQLHASTTTSTTTITTTSNAPNVSFDAGAWTGITADDKSAWRLAYPAVDVDRQIAAAAAWVVANPKNVKSNWRRFLNGWLSRAQDNAKPQGGGDQRRQVAM